MPATTSTMKPAARPSAPHFQKMFADARARKFDLVLFWSLDRLSREGVSAMLGHLEHLTGYGVGWRSHTEEYLDSCGIFRDAVLDILATIAKQERIRRSERASAAIARLRRQGQAISSDGSRTCLTGTGRAGFGLMAGAFARPPRNWASPR